MSDNAKDAVVLTGASAGLGVEFANRFAQRGHNLMLVARRKQRLDELADTLRAAHGVEVLVHAADLMDPDAPAAVLAAMDEAGWVAGILINNAGFGVHDPFHETEPARSTGQVRLNCEALTHLCALFAPRMVARGKGQILNVASTAAFQPGPGMSVYCATKAYVLSFSEGLAQELRGTGVTVTAHCPGATATEFGQVARNDETLLFAANVATASDVVDDAIAAMDRGTVVRVQGFMNRLMSQMPRFVPRAVARFAAAKVLQRR